MRRMFIGLLAATALALPAAAQDGAIRSVIDTQLEAFKADDFAAAFRFASPTIRNMFRSPDVFGQMVAQGYPMVHRPADVAFLDLRRGGAGRLQVVQIRDAAGVFHLLEYEMVETADGWLINGVRYLPQPQIGA